MSAISKKIAGRAGRAVRGGVLGVALSDETREAYAIAQGLRDRLNAAAGDAKLTPRERAADARAAVESARRQAAAFTSRVQNDLARVMTAAKNVDSTLFQVEQKVSGLGVERLRRIAAGLPQSPQERANDIRRAVERRDHERLMAHSIADPTGAAPRRALAVLAAPDDLRFVLERGASTVAARAASSLLERGLAELAELEDAADPRHVGDSARDLLDAANSGFEAFGLTRDELLPFDAPAYLADVMTPKPAVPPKAPAPKAEQPVTPPAGSAA